VFNRLLGAVVAADRKDRWIPQGEYTRAPQPDQAVLEYLIQSESANSLSPSSAQNFATKYIRRSRLRIVPP